jgi:hypothetical protein
VYLWGEPPSLAKKRILTPKKEPWCWAAPPKRNQRQEFW